MVKSRVKKKDFRLLATTLRSKAFGNTNLERLGEGSGHAILLIFAEILFYDTDA
jgi:hypothetical protein